MEPLRFNYLLALWKSIYPSPSKDLVDAVLKDSLVKIEHELSQYVREQKVIDELKIKAGINS